VAEERHRQRALAEHLGREREVEHVERAAAVLVGEREARDADLDESLPERGVVSVAGLEQRSQPRRRTLRRGEAADRILEQSLLFREPEIHGAVLLLHRMQFARPPDGRSITFAAVAVALCAALDASADDAERIRRAVAHTISTQQADGLFPLRLRLPGRGADRRAETSCARRACCSR
jgi:hypothetical protein